MRKAKPRESGSDNLLLAVALLVGFAGLTAYAVAYVSGYVLDEMNNRDFMVMIVTDSGLKSDNKQLEANLSTATLALRSIRDLGWALSVGCLGVGVAVFIRSRRQNAS